VPGASVPPNGWKWLHEGETIEVEVAASEDAPAVWVTAEVLTVRIDGSFQARIVLPDGSDQWDDWFSWQEEGSDWRRRAKRVRVDKAPIGSLLADEIDLKLWAGASAAGWTVIRKTCGNYRYVSPSGAVYTSRSAVDEAKAEVYEVKDDVEADAEQAKDDVEAEAKPSKKGEKKEKKGKAKKTADLTVPEQPPPRQPPQLPPPGGGPPMSGAPPPPNGWKWLHEGETIEVEVAASEDAPAVWVTAEVLIALIDGSFQARIVLPDGSDQWDDWFSWQEEGSDWRRRAKREAPEEAPEGFRYATCPRLETDEDYRKLVGRKVLVAHERKKNLEPNWYMGRIKLFGVSAAWKKTCPSANFIIKYSKTETGNALDGDSAIELATHNYGVDEWWLLLDPLLPEE
jgi:hypothetical protein